MNSTVCHWDFFGSEATKTAEHFKHHMNEFTQKQKFEPAAQGFFSVHTSHTCYWIEILDPLAAQETQKKLRPQRSLSRREHDQLLEELTAQET